MDKPPYVEKNRKSAEIWLIGDLENQRYGYMEISENTLNLVFLHFDVVGLLVELVDLQAEQLSGVNWLS